MTIVSFSPTAINLFIDKEINNGGDISTSFEIHAYTASSSTLVELNYDGVSSSFALPNTVDTITAGEIYYFKV